MEGVPAIEPMRSRPGSWCEVQPWLRRGVALPRHSPRLVDANCVVFAASISLMYVQLGVLSQAVGALIALDFVVFLLAMNRVMKNIHRADLLPDVLGFLVDEDARAGAVSAAELEVKLHVGNGGGPPIAVLLLYFFSVRQILEGKPAAEQALLQINSLVLFFSWTFAHMTFWPVLTLYRLVCRLLALAAAQHIGGIASIVSDSTLTADKKVHTISGCQEEVSRLFRKANSSITIPMLVTIVGAGLLSTSLILTLYVAVPQDVGGFALLTFMLFLSSLAWPLLLYGMASVCDAYDDSTYEFQGNHRLINLVEEVFPNNAGTFITALQTQHLGFKVHRHPINISMLMTTLASVALTALLAVVFKVTQVE